MLEIQEFDERVRGVAVRPLRVSRRGTRGDDDLSQLVEERSNRTRCWGYCCLSRSKDRDRLQGDGNAVQQQFGAVMRPEVDMSKCEGQSHFTTCHFVSSRMELLISVLVGSPGTCQDLRMGEK